MGIKCNCSTVSIESGINGLEIGVKNIKNGNTDCYKCGRPAIISARENSCKECFLKVFSKNFRSNLRTKCLEEKDSNRILAILYQGGFVSSSLLHLILSRNNDRHLKANDNKNGTNNDEFDFSFRKLTDSDDLKLRFLVNVENPLSENDDLEEEEEDNDKENFIRSSREQFRVIQTIFEKFTNKYKYGINYELSCIVECMINNVKLSNMRSCYFLHTRDLNNSTTIATGIGANTGSDTSTQNSNSSFIEECTDRCYEFISKCRRLFREDPDCGYHIWRTIRLINLKTYFRMNRQNKVYLLMPETQDDVCKKALFLTSIGLGEEVNHRCSFVDKNSIEEIRILRPLKTFTLKEMAFYNKFNELEQVFKSKSQFNFGNNSSIFGCISYFTDELNLQHSNIFHNITNITNRLVDKPNGLLDKAVQGCSICNLSLNTNLNGKGDYKLCNNYNNEDEQVCKGCEYFSLKHLEMIEYFKSLFYG